MQLVAREILQEGDNMKVSISGRSLHMTDHDLPDLIPRILLCILSQCSLERLQRHVGQGTMMVSI